uniref:Sodium/potassium-transporting ATPase subunit beta-3 n=1 Tax=Astyanax mexicanus TaxID=7994 RepID=A0A3B1JKY0_ASTMX
MSKKEEKPGEQKNESESNWKHAIYNPNTGEFVGRTASSWGLILLFYLVFYGFLAGMFTLTMWAMLQTLDDNVPKYSDRVPSPGLVIRPSSMEIVYNRSDPLQYQQHVEHLETLLQQYNDTEQVKNELSLSLSDRGKYPLFLNLKLDRYGVCVYIYIYIKYVLCLVIKVCVYIKCVFSKCSQVQVQYFPQEGRIDRMYFPYYGKKAHVGYVQPLVGVKLMLRKEDYSKELMVECRVEGSNLKNNDERDKFLGRVSFRVLVTE